MVFGLWSSFGQIPQGFNYQAIARDGSGNPIVNTALPVRITIQADSLGTTILWQEVHASITSNSYGLINLVIGRGARQASSTVALFSDIDWTITPKFIKTEIYFGTGYLTMGVSRLWSVPYALRAKDSDQWTSSGSNIYRASGSVGIGTTTPASTLHVAGTTLVEGILAGQYYTGQGTVLLVGNDSKLEDINVANTMGIYGMEDATQGHIKLGSSGPTISGVLGNVGIGTMNPGSYKLNVNGGSVLINDGTGISGTLKLAGHSYIGSADWGNLSLSTGTNSGNAAIFLNTENATRLTILGSGNVGIGTTNPGYKLEVNGGIGSSGLVITSGVQTGLMIYKTDNSADQKSTELVSLGTSGNFVGRFVNDAYTQAEAWLNVARNPGTYTVNSVTFPSGKVGIGTASSASKVAIQPESTWSDEVPLFEVKNKLGVPVLAVYNNGVRILVDHTLGKGVKSGFAVGGYDMTKAGKTVDFMVISPDSIRFNINNDNTKAVKSGFAVGGYDATKGAINQDFMYITPQGSANGNYNTFLGFRSGYSASSTGNYNSFMGFQAGYSNYSGYSNVFLGYNAGYANYGPTTLNPSNGINNVYIGTEAGLNNKGYNNVLLGDASGSALTGGYSNVYIGCSSGLQDLTGHNNTYIGTFAGRYENGSDNVMIGYGAGFGSDESNLLVIGNRNNNALISGFFNTSKLYLWAQVGIGSSDVGTYKLYVAGNAWATGTWGSSDIRWKKNITDLSNTLDKINKLNPVTFEWRTDEFPKINFDGGVQIGLIAQDVEDIFPELVKTNSDGYKAIAYDKLNAVLIKGMQEQQSQIESQQKQIDELTKAVTELRKAVASSSR